MPTPTDRVAIHGQGLLIHLSPRQTDRQTIYANATERTAAYYVFHEKDVYIYDNKRIICEYLFILFIIYLPFIYLSSTIYLSSILSGYSWTGRREGGGSCTGGGGDARLYGWMEACMACVVDG